jgi:hypothetical protein
MHRVIDDDSKYVEQALHEYRETTEDCSNFADLHREAQHVILQRAQKLKDSKRGRITAKSVGP